MTTCSTIVLLLQLQLQAPITEAERGMATVVEVLARYGTTTSVRLFFAGRVYVVDGPLVARTAQQQSRHHPSGHHHHHHQLLRILQELGCIFFGLWKSGQERCRSATQNIPRTHARAIASMIAPRTTTNETGPTKQVVALLGASTQSRSTWCQWRVDAACGCC